MEDKLPRKKKGALRDKAAGQQPFGWWPKDLADVGKKKEDPFDQVLRQLDHFWQLMTEET